jgi:hypothetical protein
MSDPAHPARVGPLNREVVHRARHCVANLIRGVEVSYRGFVPSVAALVAPALLAVWALVMVVLMWRASSRPANAEETEGLPAPALTAG